MSKTSKKNSHSKTSSKKQKAQPNDITYSQMKEPISPQPNKKKLSELFDGSKADSYELNPYPELKETPHVLDKPIVDAFGNAIPFDAVAVSYHDDNGALHYGFVSKSDYGFVVHPDRPATHHLL